jgi:hypothetical protein
MTALVTAGGGFLLAVLWFDLMFDVQVLGHRSPGALPDEVLASISGYYRRVTIQARPMNRLVAAVMLATLAAIVAQIASGDGPAWVGWTSLALAASGIGVAVTHTVRSGARLGTRRDSVEVQSHIARSILRDHLFCLAAIVSLVAIQLAFA